MLFRRKNRQFLAAAGVAALFLCWGQAGHAGSTVTAVFEISDRTPRGLSGKTGVLDLQFDAPAGPPYAAYATATVYDFTSNGHLRGLFDAPTGNATGDLSSMISFSNGTPQNGGTSSTNEVTQYFRFGSFFDVFVSITIPIPGPTDPTTTFALSIYDHNLNPVQSYGGPGSNTPSVLITPDADAVGYFDVFSGPGLRVRERSYNIQPTPEPSTLVLAAMGLATMGGGAAWRQRRSRAGQKFLTAPSPE
jgi:hypothetical protein